MDFRKAWGILAKRFGTRGGWAQRIEAFFAGSEELIRPLVDMAARGRWNLAAASELDPAELAGVIAAATGREVTKVILISWENAPEWMTREAFLRALDESIGESLGAIMLERSKQRAATEWKGSELAARLGFTGLLRDVAGWFRSLAGGTVEQVIKLSFGEVLGAKFRSNLEICYVHLLSAVLAGDEAEVRQASSLMRHYPRTFFLGTKKGEPTAWLLLVR